MKQRQRGVPFFEQRPYAPTQDLRKRFGAALPDFVLALPSDQFVKLLLLATQCTEGEYQLGQARRTAHHALACVQMGLLSRPVRVC